MAPRRRGTRKGRANQSAILKYEFSYIMNVNIDDSVKAISYGQLGIDASRPLRVLDVRVNACCSGGSCASLCLAIYGTRIGSGDSLRSVCVRSRTLSCGATARTIFVSSPRVMDFFTPDSSDYIFALESGVAQPGTGSVTHIVVSGEVTLQFQTRSAPIIIK